MNDWLKEVREEIKDDPHNSCLGKNWLTMPPTETENTRSKLWGGWGRGKGEWWN